jgi:hypothetical protein
MKMEWSLIVVALVARPAVAQDAHVTEDAHIKRTGKSATSFSIGGYWQANKNCEPTGDPFTFLIEKPPEHGSVCFGRDAVAMHHLVAGSNKKDIEQLRGPQYSRIQSLLSITSGI